MRHRLRTWGRLRCGALRLCWTRLVGLLRSALRAVDVLHVLRLGPTLLRLGYAGALLDRRGAGRSRVALLQLLAVLLLLLDGAWSFGDVCRASFSRGTGEGYLRGASVVGVEGLLRVVRGGLHGLALGGDGPYVGLVQSGDFSRAWTDVEAAATAVVADAIDDVRTVVDVVIDDFVVVDVGGETAVGDGEVLEEVVAVPIAAEVADADVAEAVVDATVEADVEAPVAVVKAVVAAVVAPVGGSPKRAVVGRRAPDSGDPVVAGVGVAPVAGGPDVVGIGSGGLVVFG